MANAELVRFIERISLLPQQRDEVTERIGDDFETLFQNTASARSMAALAYLRDIQLGAGEREAFRIAFYRLSEIYPSKAGRFLKFIPIYGRWDDMIIFGPHPKSSISSLIVSAVMTQLHEDTRVALGKKPGKVSELAKWMPSEATSSYGTWELSQFWMTKLGYIGQRYMRDRPDEYRRMISLLRAKIPIVERLMSANQWADIDYATVPIHALRQYQKAFLRHDGERFTRWCDAHAYLLEKRKPIESASAADVAEFIMNSERYAAVRKEFTPV